MKDLELVVKFSTLFGDLDMIKHKGNKFYLEIFTPEHRWKYLGKVIDFYGICCFMTHLKIYEKHFFYKYLTYPINLELLDKLKLINVKLVAIPENNYQMVKIYLAPLKKLLQGGIVHEPSTEKQRCIPLEEMKVVEMDKYSFQHEYVDG